ncbi:protein SPT2 homolog [Euwallacea fornicatus]|uniref:protein SPT2 homolog n=1 Tax=Euwallacea fornicatus TaxID=995702 RepID=UPI00338E389E
MDFCQLLHKAKKNEQNVGGRYYSTKYEPPKKVKKETKNLSDNIKKFLAKKEEEERKKQAQEQKKKEELLALRSQDKKATRRVNVMLKRTKSANQSVIEDAIDKTHTAVTMAGPDQPDEDDYGYVSQEASALYEKMMQKYSQLPEEPKFKMFKKKVSTNLNNTKDRVKAALEKEKQDAMLPRKRKRKSKLEDGQEVDEEIEDREPEVNMKQGNRKEGDTVKSKPKHKPASPPMSFTEILKIAAQKQHEPIVIEVKPQEEEKLYTKKQKKELEREKEFRERREKRDKERLQPPGKTETNILERQLTKSNSTEKVINNNHVEKSVLKQPNFGAIPLKKQDKTSERSSSNSIKDSNSRPNFNKNLNNIASKKDDIQKIAKSDMNGAVRSENGARKQILSGRKSEILKNSKLQFRDKPKEFPPRDLMTKDKPKQLQLKQFPPRDVREVKRKPLPVNRGRILDDDDEEYDSEMDDFIDDDPEEGDYSKYIKEIFGYDKSRYRDRYDDVDNMETSFAQQMKEEVISTKIGIMEDLEDMKKEEEEKRRKAMLKKKMRQ